jgi:hypothetical protein
MVMMGIVKPGIGEDAEVLVRVCFALFREWELVCHTSAGSA